MSQFTGLKWWNGLDWNGGMEWTGLVDCLGVEVPHTNVPEICHLATAVDQLHSKSLYPLITVRGKE